MRYLTLVFFVVFFMVSCKTAEKMELVQKKPRDFYDDNISVQLTNAPIQFVFESFPLTDFDKSVSETDTLYLSVFVFDKGETSQMGDIRPVEVSYAGVPMWRGTSAVGAEYTGGWFRFKPKGPPGCFPLGQYSITIPTRNINYKKDFRPSLAVSNKDQSYDYVYAPEYQGKIEPNYLAVLGRPKMSKAVLTSSGLTISFQVSDPRAITGAISLLDKTGKIVAIYFPFLDGSSSEVSREYVGNYSLNNNGSDNVVHIGLNNLKYSYGKSADDIYYATVTVRSGSIGKIATDKDQVIFSSGSGFLVVEKVN